MKSTRSNALGAGGKGQPLFQNPILEKLTRTHISVPLVIFAVVSVGIFTYGLMHASVPVSLSIMLFLVGVFAFTLLEYLMHRYVFHMHTDTEIKEKMQYAFHGWHHEYPKDKERLAMPPLVSIVLSVLFFTAFNFLLGEYVYSFLPGFIVGYMGYLSVHYIVHAYKPPRNFLRHLWINHSIHHHREHDRAYGVSSPLWDYVFGTMPRKKTERA